MTRFFKNLIYLIIITVLMGGFYTKIYAQIPPTVEFEQTPLFNDLNFVPGMSVSRFIKLNNQTSEPHRAILRAINVDNTGNLKNVVKIVIKNEDVILYNDTFAKLFNLPELVLMKVPANSSARFDLIVTFKDDAGNEYQNGTMGFNLQVGFEDSGELVNDTVVISGGGGGNGPIVIGQKNLIINNESISSAIPPQNTTVTITWDTNMPSTSQVIYGLESNGPYSLDLTKDNFGYPFMTQEDFVKVLNHSVSISNIIPGQVYIYRVISRASPPTISYEHKFILNSDGTATVFNDSVTNSENSEQEIVTNNKTNLGLLDNNYNLFKENKISSTTNNINISDNINQTANILNAFNLSKKSLFYWIIFLILIILLILFIYKNRKNKQS